MSIVTCVDTNILSDIFLAGPRSDIAAATLAECLQQSDVQVSAIVYAELLVVAPSPKAVSRLLSDMGISLDLNMSTEMWNWLHRRGVIIYSGGEIQVVHCIIAADEDRVIPVLHAKVAVVRSAGDRVIYFPISSLVHTP